MALSHPDPRQESFDFLTQSPDDIVMAARQQPSGLPQAAHSQTAAPASQSAHRAPTSSAQARPPTKAKVSHSGIAAPHQAVARAQMAHAARTADAAGAEASVFRPRICTLVICWIAWICRNGWGRAIWTSCISAIALAPKLEAGLPAAKSGGFQRRWRPSETAQLLLQCAEGVAGLSIADRQQEGDNSAAAAAVQAQQQPRERRPYSEFVQDEALAAAFQEADAAESAAAGAQMSANS